MNKSLMESTLQCFKTRLNKGRCFKGLRSIKKTVYIPFEHQIYKPNDNLPSGQT